MFAVIYRWRVKPEKEPEFLRTWHARTQNILVWRGSHGSRLHREPDGTYCAIALWPSREAWETADPPLPGDEPDATIFRESIAESLTTLTMEAIDDLWHLPPNKRKL